MDEHMSWDDDNNVPQKGDRVALMQEEPVEGRHGFVVYDACWRLFQVALDPYDVPEISQLLALRRDETESQVLRLSWESRDCFMRIPMEIRETIAVSLVGRTMWKGNDVYRRS
jgi:hypothetical protein